MARESSEIDREKLRAEVRKLGNEFVFCMLDDAINLLPPAKLYQIVPSLRIQLHSSRSWRGGTRRTRSFGEPYGAS